MENRKCHRVGARPTVFRLRPICSLPKFSVVSSKTRWRSGRTRFRPLGVRVRVGTHRISGTIRAELTLEFIVIATEITPEKGGIACEYPNG